MAQVKTEGFDELAKALRQLHNGVADRVLLKSVRASANVVKKAAQAKAPVGTVTHYVGKKAKGRYVFPGFLASNIVLRKAKSPRSQGIIDVRVRRAFYWFFLEFGTSKIPAKPFLRPAMTENYVTALNELQRVLGKGIEAEVKKLR